MYTNWGVFNIIVFLFFKFDPSERLARAEILQKNLVNFWAMEFQEKMLLRFTNLQLLALILAVFSDSH